jgi:hypothetical protein
MSRAIIDERMKDVIFKGAKWVIEFTPSIASIGRMKLMSAAHSEDPIFNVSTKTTGSKIDLILVLVMQVVMQASLYSRMT